MNKKTKYIFAAIFITTLVIMMNRKKVHMAFVKISQSDATFANYDSNNKLDGKVIRYVKGNIDFTGNFSRGVKQGWEVAYYTNGKIKSKTYFNNGLPSGKGYIYKENGELDYAGDYLDGKPYGGWYNYYDNGLPKRYLLYDINKNISFSVGYDSTGNINLQEMHGLVVSSAFYSVKLEGKKIVPLKPYPGINNISAINKDLLITVAKPKDTKLKVSLDVNGRKYEFLDIRTNTLKIKNLISKGKYEIFLKSYLYGKQDTVINGINIKTLLVFK